MAYVNIALSGQIGVGGTSLAKVLSQQLGWPLRDGSQIFRDISMHLGHDLEQSPQQYDDAVDRKVDEETRALLQTNQHSVVASKLAGFLSRDLRHTFRILVTCPLQERIKRYAKDRGHQGADARKLLLLREQKDQEKWERLYGPNDFFDPSFFHLVLDSGTLSVEEEVQRVVDSSFNFL